MQSSTQTSTAAMPMATTVSTDVAIVGGGLAGLSLAIQLARNGYSVLLFEKETYPFHRVCGEYISMESWSFIEELGIPIGELNLPSINELLVSAPNGRHIIHPLKLGGFGISRYLLDSKLAILAKSLGVVISEQTKITDITYNGHEHTLFAGGLSWQSKLVFGCFGKRSNLDVKWKRPFVLKEKNALSNYVGIKYHVLYDAPANRIALHNFPGGYCGMSRIEENKYCLCYLTTAANLKKSGNSIAKMEETILQQNPFLNKIFSSAYRLFEQPVAISQVSFMNKAIIENHVLMAGDAAGMITPLCGNGMSMALHASKIAADIAQQFLEDHISRNEMERKYQQQWKKLFSRRLSIGRTIQRFFGSAALSNALISSLKPFPKVMDVLIEQTHGQPF